jgi:hypothetical protein
MALRNFIHGLAGSLLVVLVIAATNWPSLVAFRIRQNLHDYGVTIRHCDCSLSDKERLLDILDDLEERVGRGEQSSLFLWADEDEIIRSLLKGRITPERVRLIERELLKVRRKLVSDQ